MILVGTFLFEWVQENADVSEMHCRESTNVELGRAHALAHFPYPNQEAGRPYRRHHRQAYRPIRVTPMIAVVTIVIADIIASTKSIKSTGNTNGALSINQETMIENVQAITVAHRRTTETITATVIISIYLVFLNFLQWQN